MKKSREQLNLELDAAVSLVKRLEAENGALYELLRAVCVAADIELPKHDRSRDLETR